MNTAKQSTESFVQGLDKHDLGDLLLYIVEQMRSIEEDVSSKVDYELSRTFHNSYNELNYTKSQLIGLKKSFLKTCPHLMMCLISLKMVQYSVNCLLVKGMLIALSLMRGRINSVDKRRDGSA